MGLKDRGYVLRLERCAQKLPPFNVAINQTSIVSLLLLHVYLNFQTYMQSCRILFIFSFTFCRS